MVDSLRTVDLSGEDPERMSWQKRELRRVSNFFFVAADDAA